MEESLEMEMTFEDIFMMLKKRWMMIVTFVIIGLVVGAAYTHFTYVPRYSTYTTMLLNSYDVDFEMSSSLDYYIREDLSLTFQGIINSKNLREQVKERLGIENLGSISVSADDSSIIRINVTHLDPELGADVANEVADVFGKIMKEMMYDMDFSILDKAEANYFPQAKGTLTTAMIGAILGGILSVGLCFALDYLDKTFKTSKETSKILDLPVIGMIPDAFNNKGNKKWTPNGMTFINSKSSVTEAYRTLQTNINFSSVDDELKTITITSSGKEEGKTMTAIHLALTYSQAGQKTLLVDCDLRCPNIHKLFELSNRQGLINLLYLREKLEDIKQSVNKNLDILTAGISHPNPVEVLNSNRMKEFIKDVREVYDIVIFDTPPIGLVTDGAIVSANTDRTLLVVATGKSEIELTLNVKQQLKNVNANLLGIVMTMMPVKAKEDYYYYRNVEVETSKKYQVEFRRNRK